MLPVADVWQVLVYYSTGNADLIIWYIRLPRVLAAIVCDVGLAATGIVLQSVLKKSVEFAIHAGRLAGCRIRGGGCDHVTRRREQRGDHGRDDRSGVRDSGDDRAVGREACGHTVGWRGTGIAGKDPGRRLIRM